MAQRTKYKVKTFTLPDGTRKYIYGKTKKEVEEKYQTAIVHMRAGVDLKNHDTFGEFAQQWFNTYKLGTVTDGVATQIKRHLNLYIMPHLAPYQMKNITPMQCKVIFTEMEKAGKSEATQTKVYQILKAIFRVAQDCNLIYRSPVNSSVTHGGRKAKKKKPLSATQVETLCKAIKGKDIEPFVILVLGTGLRRGEALGLLWENVDMERRELHVRTELQFANNNQGVLVDDLKSEAAYRTIPLPDSVYTSLLRLWAQRDETGLVFHRNGKALSYSQFRSMWRAVPTDIAEDLTPHVLRHTTITNWIATGLDIKAAQYLAGHATPDVTLQIYATYLADERREETRKKIIRA